MKNHPSCSCHSTADNLTRRDFFGRMADGICGIALTSLFMNDFFDGPEAFANAPEAVRRIYDLRPRAPHFAPKAKSVIQLFMNGGPSQMDLFDPKPMLDKHHGEAYVDKLNATEIPDVEHAGALMRSPFKFAQHGQSGMWFSDVMPHLAKHADDIAVIRSMHTVNPSHDIALWKIHSGQPLPGYPAMGAWVVYGLGSENQNLPAYVVLDDPL